MVQEGSLSSVALYGLGIYRMNMAHEQ